MSGIPQGCVLINGVIYRADDRGRVLVRDLHSNEVRPAYPVDVKEGLAHGVVEIVADLVTPTGATVANPATPKPINSSLGQDMPGSPVMNAAAVALAGAQPSRSSK